MATSQEPAFHLFPLLPPELRLRIWALNLPTSRLIPINCLSTATSSSSSSNKTPSGCISPASIPANLHTVSESRLHALGTRYEKSLSFARSAPTLMIDFTADVVYFPAIPGYMASTSNFHTCLTLCAPDELSKIERLAIHEDVFSTGTGEDWYYSGLAVERTVEVLGMVRRRLGGVGECVFVCRAMVGRRERLGEQVRTAMGDLGWEGGISWSVVEEP